MPAPADVSDPGDLDALICVEDFERRARERLPAMAWDYYASGADDELTLGRNRSAFSDWELHYRVLAGVGERTLATEVLGQRIALPIALAPTAFHGLADPEGEVATARAASAAGTVMTLSSLSNRAVEDVVAASEQPVWFQLYVYRDRAMTGALIDRVEAAGCRALVLTVDAPMLGRRLRDARNRFELPDGLSIANVAADRLPEGSGDSGLAAYFAQLIDPDLSWSDLEWLRGRTSLPVVVKGIVRPDDAERAVAAGASGIWVSNHGGRQLDTAPATIDVLESVARAVAGRADVLVDGGIRRGTDVVKALALGARAVMIGRPILWGLGSGGELGVARVLGVLRSEIDRALALCGCSSAAAVGRELVQRRPT